jgi:hypothetical protein
LIRIDATEAKEYSIKIIFDSDGMDDVGSDRNILVEAI